MDSDTLQDALVRQIQHRGYAFSFGFIGEEQGHKINGQTDNDLRTVTVDPQPSDDETVVSVIAHELGHIVADHEHRQASVAHTPFEQMGWPLTDGIGTPQGEVEAELISNGVLRHFGLRDDAAEDYVSTWERNASVVGQHIDMADVRRVVGQSVDAIVQGVSV